jgi:hypothetical protein
MVCFELSPWDQGSVGQIERSVTRRANVIEPAGIAALDPLYLAGTRRTWKNEDKSVAIRFIEHRAIGRRSPQKKA